LSEKSTTGYRGRLAPSPTGFLHLGHARTFWVAQTRAQARSGMLILRNEDIDRDRSKAEFVTAMLHDLRWFGFEWQEGPDRGGPMAPYNQSERIALYREAFEKLRAKELIYPCNCSRKDVLRASQAPHGEDEVIYPGTCRGKTAADAKGAVNWRFRIPENEAVLFVDGCLEMQSFTGGRHFGDFIVWRHDDVPAYQLAVVVDDAGMAITEVVRGADLLISTARQLLLYQGLKLQAPAFYHCPLLTDENGVRLAKRHQALSLRALRQQGFSPDDLRKNWGSDIMSVAAQA
jgi:glutamyl-tRNA synthetase